MPTSVFERDAVALQLRARWTDHLAQRNLHGMSEGRDASVQGATSSVTFGLPTLTNL
jgi:hypothetical protein